MGPDLAHETAAALSGLLVRTGDLPLPGGGRTPERWRALATIARADVTLGRLAEAHYDAVAILAELGGPATRSGQVWGVWAADPPSARLAATRDGGTWQLDGTKAWCSGAGGCTDALVTAHAADGYRLFAVDLAATRESGAAAPVDGTWSGVGMVGGDTRSVTFTGAPARAIGGPGAYLDRPGFWHGAVGVAAAWYGGARGVADALHVAGVRRPLDGHALAHTGAVGADLAAARALLVAAGEEIDADPADGARAGMARAFTVRAVVEAAATRTLESVGRALGPAPLAQDRDHSRRVADLTVYLRQSHAERDLETLARELLTDGPLAW